MDEIPITRDADLYIPGDDDNYPIEIWIEEEAYRIISHSWGSYILLFHTNAPTIYGILFASVQELLNLADHRCTDTYTKPLYHAVTNYVLQRDFDKELIDG
jgi:hypothetical protein